MRRLPCRRKKEAQRAGDIALDEATKLKSALDKVLEVDLKAIVEENTLKIPGLEDEVSTLGREVADKQNDLVEAKKVRDAERADFVAIEKDLVTSIDQLGKAAEIISKASGGAFLQGGSAEGATSSALKAISKILDAGEINMATRKSLGSLLQTGEYDEDEESIHQAHTKSGGSAAIVEKNRRDEGESRRGAYSGKGCRDQEGSRLRHAFNAA